MGDNKNTVHKSTFVNMENQIQLAYILKTPIQCFDQNLKIEKNIFLVLKIYLNKIENAKFRFGRVNAKDKIECGIMTINKSIIGTANLINVNIIVPFCVFLICPLFFSGQIWNSEKGFEISCGSFSMISQFIERILMNCE